MPKLLVRVTLVVALVAGVGVLLVGCSLFGGAPLPPGSLTVTSATDTSITITWNGSSGATGYELDRDGAWVYDGSDTTYTDEGLVAGTTYYYKVMAYGPAGQSAFSDEIAGTTTGGAGSHTYADASADLVAYNQGVSAGAGSTNSGDTAYHTTVGDVFTYHFSGYIYNGITLNGTVDVDTSVSETNGTVNFSGGALTSIVFNAVRSSSGTEVITFTDTTVWTYDFSDYTFTEG